MPTLAKPTTLPTAAQISALPRSPLRILFSACLLGDDVVGDGRIFPVSQFFQELLALPNVVAVRFCPEAPVMGIRRPDPDCVGGNGFDLLDGRGRMLDADGHDWTTPMIQSAKAMAGFAVRNECGLAILLHISGACGTSVIYDGLRAGKVYQKGPGLAAAAVHRAGIPIVSQLDWRSLRLLRNHLDPEWKAPSSLPEIDHWEGDWYQEYFDTATVE